MSEGASREKPPDLQAYAASLLARPPEQRAQFIEQALQKNNPDVRLTDRSSRPYQGNDWQGVVVHLIELGLQSEDPTVRATAASLIAHAPESYMHGFILRGKEDQSPEVRAVTEAIEAKERVDLREAERIMGKDFIGPAAIEKAYGFKPDVIPEIPYTREQLEQAKKLGEMLILRVDKDNDGKPITIGRVQTLKTGEKVLYSDHTNFSNEPPLRGWRLVSKDVIPGSRGKNYFEQTIILYDHLVEVGSIPQDNVARAQLLADVEAIRFFYEQDKNKNVQEATKRLAQLPVNDSYRRRAVEQTYDLGAAFSATGERHLPPGTWDWGSSRYADGYLVNVGYFDADGAYLDGDRSGIAHPDIGVCSSR